MTQSDAVTLRGIIIPAEWGPDGRHTAVSLAADDEHEYRISNDTQYGRLIFQALRHRVQVECRLLQSEGNAKHRTIQVRDYKVIEDNQVK